ncbi:L,D-transpeptidase/peptidoglycan binding protein [Actinomyces sp. B33]|uniref:L,D-transpeptidase family protein n=1 Tax=Actinomyces sp. B33 TaxID=2942131 RepID=UPI00233FF407|nr:L,D-transpeptidase family protein [Actinomyces sp. B33]MDC4233533.1 L,D-transpeptidase/peptidoglycan binding protein [Actinomyces sp. B33]
MMSTVSSPVKWAVGVLSAVVLVVVAGTAAFAVNYRDKALPGTTVAGQSVAGMTRDEIVASLRERIDASSASVDVDGTRVEAPLAEAGVAVDAEATADAALAPGSSLASQVSALMSPPAVDPVVVTDEEAVEAFVARINEAAGANVQNAAVVPGGDGASFTVTPASSGAGVTREQVLEAITAQARALSSTPAPITPVPLDPQVTTEQAQEAADAANALVGLDVTITDGIDSFTATGEEKASWVALPAEEGDGLAEPSFDEGKIAEWIAATAEKSNVAPVNGVHNVNSAGEVLTVAKEGVSGWSVNNIDAVTRDAVAALTAGQSYAGEFDYDEVKPSFDTRRVAEGAENLVYQAGEGEKWIDLDLSSATVTAYVGGSVAGGPYYMVPGDPQTPTVTGTYRVYLKYASQTMRGENVDGSKYVTPDVPWVTYFTGSYAFHGAPWRSSFGWSGPGGSHGCVNMPVSAAKFIYDWADMGTVVVSHY